MSGGFHSYAPVSTSDEFSNSSPSRLTRMSSRTNRRGSVSLLSDGASVGRRQTDGDAPTSELNSWLLAEFQDVAGMEKVVDLLGHMVSQHMLAFSGILLSFFGCVWAGAVNTSFVDPSFFRATGLLLAVLISLRAKNAMSRRSQLMQGVLAMMNSARNMLEICGVESKEKRRRLRAMLGFSFLEIAAWVGTASGEDWPFPKLSDLDPEDREVAFRLRGKCKLRTSPRPLLIYLRQYCDDLFDVEEHTLRCNRSMMQQPRCFAAKPTLATLDELPSKLIAGGSSERLAPAVPLEVQSSRRSEGEAENSEEQDDTTDAVQAVGQPSPTNTAERPIEEMVDRISVIRRWHRNMERDLHTITANFDVLLMYRERLLTPQFRFMLGCVIFVYIALYPWCVRNESSVILGVTTVGMAFVFYGLNAMTEQLEDPVLHRGQGFNLSLTFRKMFADMDRDELVRDYCERFLHEKRSEGMAVTDELHDMFEEWAASRSDLIGIPLMSEVALQA